MSVQVSIVLPCLNEGESLGRVLDDIQRAYAASTYSFEMIVVDNGSTDATAEIARAKGARVVQVMSRGYGNALKGGFEQAQGSVIVFGDADGTYDFKESVALVDRLLQGDVAMVIGSRLKGSIQSGAMPLLHRYVGTPLLSLLIAILFRARISDCNSGMRGLLKERYRQWAAQSPGMEFSSELIIGCLRSGDRIAEIPITLRPGAKGRVPHLSTWRDGMRHLLVILSRAPHGFTFIGTVLLVGSFCIAVPSIFMGPVRIGRVEIFDFHSLILSILAGFIGAQAICYALLMDVHATRPLRFNQRLLKIDEVLLLRLVNGLLLMVVGFISYVVTVWYNHGFNTLDYLRPSLTLLYFVIVIGTMGFGIFMAQVHRRM